VVQLVLEGPGREAGRLDANLLAVAVAPLDHHGLRALHLADPTRIAEAALVPRLAPFLLHHLGVHEAPDLLVVALDDAHAQRDPDLVGGQPGPRSVEHGLGEVIQQALDGRVHARNLLRLFTQDWMLEVEDLTDHRGRFYPRGAKTQPL
jgi:hypothetical protein